MAYTEGTAACWTRSGVDPRGGAAFKLAAAACRFKTIVGTAVQTIFYNDLVQETEETFDRVRATFATEDDACVAGIAQDAIEACRASLTAEGDGGMATRLRIGRAKHHTWSRQLLLRVPVGFARYSGWLVNQCSLGMFKLSRSVQFRSAATSSGG